MKELIALMRQEQERFTDLSKEYADQAGAIESAIIALGFDVKPKKAKIGAGGGKGRSSPLNLVYGNKGEVLTETMSKFLKSVDAASDDALSKHLKELGVLKRNVKKFYPQPYLKKASGIKKHADGLWRIK